MKNNRDKYKDIKIVQHSPPLMTYYFYYYIFKNVLYIYPIEKLIYSFESPLFSDYVMQYFSVIKFCEIILKTLLALYLLYIYIEDFRKQRKSNAQLKTKKLKSCQSRY